MIRFVRFDTPLGPMIATAASGALTAVDFADAKYAPVPEAGWTEDPEHAPLAACALQLGAYFSAQRPTFDLPTAPSGTEFQRRVWRAIAGVPYGETLPYARLAERAGAPGAARAAGAATGRNPLAVIVPCHRIVGANGRLTGYAGGLERKARLLELEASRRPGAT